MSASNPTPTAEEVAALRNLAVKNTGALTAFVNIAVAQRLTELGLAQRSQQGWDITPEGAACLAAVGPDDGYPPLAIAPFSVPLRSVPSGPVSIEGGDVSCPED